MTELEKIQDNETVTICQVGNGFIVNGDHRLHRDIPISSTLVFQSMAELVRFLQVHFDHRTMTIEVDH